MKPHSKTSPWQHTAITCYQSVRFCPQAAASVFRLFSQIATFHFLGRAWRKLSKPWEFLKPSDLKRSEIRERHRKTMSNFVNMSGQPRATESIHLCSKMFKDRTASWSHASSVLYSSSPETVLVGAMEGRRGPGMQRDGLGVSWRILPLPLRHSWPRSK